MSFTSVDGHAEMDMNSTFWFEAWGQDSPGEETWRQTLHYLTYPSLVGLREGKLTMVLFLIE